MPQGSGPSSRDVVAAGTVVLGPGRRVLLVHRPRYDDWSLPKGKLDPGEPAAVAAVREAEEETGLRVRLGPPLACQRYPAAGRSKVVHYWVGWPLGDPDVSGYPANDEIDEVVWLPYDQAITRLSYPRDRETLREAKRFRHPSHALVVLRHAEALPRDEWTGPDRARPLTPAGRRQSRLLIPTLAAYDATRVVSSSSTRCVQTVQPWARSAGRPIERLDVLSEEDVTEPAVGEVADDLLAGHAGAVVCTHRAVLPLLVPALGLPQTELAKGGMLVVHHQESRVVAVELVHAP